MTKLLKLPKWLIWPKSSNWPNWPKWQRWPNWQYWTNWPKWWQLELKVQLTFNWTWMKTKIQDWPQKLYLASMSTPCPGGGKIWYQSCYLQKCISLVDWLFDSKGPVKIKCSKNSICSLCKITNVIVKSLESAFFNNLLLLLLLSLLKITNIFVKSVVSSF